LLGKIDGWQKATAGKDLEVKAGFVALVTQIDAASSALGLGKEGEEKESDDEGGVGGSSYTVKFGSVAGECYVFADGKLLGKNSKLNPFQYKFEAKKDKGKITLALLIRGGGGAGTGLVKPAFALAPRPATPGNQLLMALGYHLAGAHSDALNHYSQFLKKTPAESPDRELVKLLQNRIYAEKSDLEALAANPPAKSSLEYQMLIAELYQRDGKRDKAIEAYEKAAADFGESRGAAVALARAYEANGKHAEAIRTWLNILDKWSELGNAESYRRYVVWYAANQARDIAEARRLAREFNQPPTHYWLRTLGDLHLAYKPEDFAQAVDFYFQAYKAAAANNWYEASRVFDSLVADKKIERAIQFAELWSKENPGHSQTPLMVYKIGRAYQDAGNHPKAFEYYKKVQDEYPFSEAATTAVLNAIDLPGQDSVAMLDKWVKANQGNPRAAEMYWALCQKHEAQKAPDKAIPLYEKIWTEFPTKEPENFRSACRLAALCYASQDEATKTKGVAMMEQILDKFGGRGEPELRTVWATLGERYRAADAAKFIAHNVRVANTFPGQPAALDAQISIMAYLMEQHKYLDSAIYMQRLINGMPPRNPTWWDRIVDVGLSRVKDKRYGEAAVIFKSLLKRNEGFDANKTKDVQTYMADALSKSGAVVAEVKEGPESGIVWGNIFANAGEPELAWAKYRENEAIFATYHHLATPAFIKVIVDHLLTDKKIRDAINMCRRFMITHVNSTNLQDSDKAKIQLLLGDAYFTDERFEIARDEYTTVITMWGNTREAIDAQFKVGETLMAQKIYVKAEEIFTNLTSYRDEDTSAKAHLMLGILYHTMGELERAEEKFKEVLAMAPKNDTADMIMYRLGMVYQVSKKYREALDTLRMIGSTSGESKRVVAPGSDLRIRLSDRNLQIVKGSTSVPIVVKTASGDEETIQLSRSFAGPGLFVASIQTVLGKPVLGDKKLQVVGKDVITYDYHPDFKKDVVIEEMAEKQTITIAADAELKFSAAEIKDEQEVDIDPSVFGRREEGRQEFRTGKEIAPGNLCYVQVKDPDHDLGEDKNTCPATIETTSGDSVRVMLQETEPHSGKFRGSVQTALKPPDAVASDFAEGHEPRFAIDEDKSAGSSWIGQMDGKTPKWLMIDLKDLKTVDKIEWNRGTGYKEGEERKLIRYSIEVARKKDEWFPIAAQPGESAPLRSVKLLENTDAQPVNPYLLSMRKTSLPFISDGDTASVWQGRVKTDPNASWRVDMDMGQVCVLDRFLLKDAVPAFAVKTFSLYTEEKPGIKPVGDKGWALLHIPPNSPKNITFITRARARYLRLVVTATTGDHPEIADIDIFPKLEFKMDKAAEGIGSAFTFEPVETRFIRFTVNEFLGDAPAIGHVAVYGKVNDEVKQHIPVPGVDVHALATNQVLEVSPGDTITASYNDEVNIDPGSPKVYREMLSATYYNGQVACIRNEWIEDKQGNRTKEELTVARMDVNQKDQRLVVKIVDYDADKTDGIDKLPFTVLSRSTGNKLDLVATETGPFEGEFTKEVDVTMAGQEAQGVLKVVDGDGVEISYDDELNTDPGNRTRRSFELSETLPTAGSIEVISKLGSVASEKAEEKPIILVAVDQPLQIQVTDPDRALDSGSKVLVDLETVPGGDNARVECLVDDLEGGIFLGSIKLALGDKESPDEIVEAAGFESEFSDAAASTTKKKKEEQPTVPVLNVMGRDVIVARYVDETRPDVQDKVECHAKARIITDGTVGFYDDEYEAKVDLVHLGDKLFIKVEDGDADISEERDKAEVLVTSTVGDRLVLELVETLSHSGIFTSAIALNSAAKADQSNADFEADFGDEVRVVYSDKRNLDRDKAGNPVGAAERTAAAKVVVGTDGQLTGFGKKYPNDEIAIETQFHIGECYYYLGKEHIELKKEKLGLLELKEGQEILRDLMVHFPGSKSVDQAAYLLANLAQEQKKFYEAIDVYERITLDWPKSVIAPDAQYKMGICYEKMDDMDKAMEEYVRLAYKFPDSALVGDAMIRIGLYFFNKKNYSIAVQVFAKFVERYEDHPQVQKVAFKMGLCYILSEKYVDAGDHFKTFVEKYAKSELTPAALYWAGDAYLKANDALKSYQMFKRCIWDYPDTKWAKFARGRLTAPIFDRIAEME
jgi:TolA-binding protein